MSGSQGSIWNAAKRGEGFQLARNSNVVWFIVIFGGVVFFLGRFFSGRPLGGDAYRKTDASFLHRGSQQLQPKARKPGRWSYLPEGIRALIRIGVLLNIVAIVWGVWFGGFWDGEHFHLSIHNAVTATAFGMTAFGIWTTIVKTDTAIREARHKRGFIKPIQARVATMFGVDSSEVKVKLPRRSIRSTEEEAA